MNRALACSLVSLFALAACGGSVASNGDDGSNGSDGGTSDSGLSDGGTKTTGCPATRPDAFDSCSTPGLQCEYGTGNGGCGNAVASCSASGWAYPSPPAGGPGCLPSDHCPATRSAITDGADCGDEQLECNYPGQGRCTCFTEGFGGPVMQDAGDGNVWECEAPASGCPADRPRLGTSCSGAPADCFYGSCDMPDSLEIHCQDGVWVDEPYACAG